MSRRGLSWLTVGFAMAILYGSCMPWVFSGDLQDATQRFHRAFTFVPFGSVHPGYADILSNILLYIPLGFLLTTRLRYDRFTAPGEAVACTILAGAALSLLVETLQLFEPIRVSGIHDLLTNTTGTAIGAFAAKDHGRRWWILARRTLRRSISALPCLVAAGLVALYWCADQFFPYWPTFNLHQMEDNYNRSLLTMSAGLDVHSMGYWLYLRALPAVVLTLLIGGAIGRRSFRWRLAILTCVVFVTIIEFGKLFLPSHTANIAQITTALFGAITAGLLGRLLAGRISARSLLGLGALACGVYLAARGWCEADWIGFAGWQSRLPQGEAWLPLYHYSMRASATDVLNFAQTTTLAAAMTLCWAGSRQPKRGLLLRAMLLTLRWGLVIEAGQLLLAGRYATTTDLFCYGLGGVGGAFIARSHFFRRLVGWK